GALEARLAWSRRTRDGRWAAGERARLERAFLRAERVARTADLLDSPGEVSPEWPVLPPSPPAPRHWVRPRTAVAAVLLERGLAARAAPERGRLDVRRAQALREAGAREGAATEPRLRAARDRSGDSPVPPTRGWAGQARWALDKARTDPASAYAALR